MSRLWKSYFCKKPLNYPCEREIFVPKDTTLIMGGGEICGSNIRIYLYISTDYQGCYSRKISFSLDEVYNPGFKHLKKKELDVCGKKVFVFLEDV